MTLNSQSSGMSTGARQSKIVLRIAFLAVSTVLVLIVTKFAAIPISAFNGQEFDLGDVMIFTVAWTFGPGIGAFAGGIGSGLSDASIPSPFAPFTLVIKGTEGLLAGYIARSVPSSAKSQTVFGRRTLNWWTRFSILDKFSSCDFACHGKARGREILTLVGLRRRLAYADVEDVASSNN